MAVVFTESSALVLADCPTRWRSRLLHVAQYASAFPDSVAFPAFFDELSLTSIRFRHEVGVVRVLLHASLFSRNGAICRMCRHEPLIWNCWALR